MARVMRGHVGQGKAKRGGSRGCAVDGADGIATVGLARESLGDLRGVGKSRLHCSIWCLGTRRTVKHLGCCRSHTSQQQVMHSHDFLPLSPHKIPHTAPRPVRTYPQTPWQASTPSPRHPHSTAAHCGAVSALDCVPPASPPLHPAPPCMPSHRPGHAPSHVATTATAVPATAITAMTATSKALRANPFSPWDGNNAPLEVLEVQEHLAGPYRRVQVVSAVAARGGRGKLTVLGSKGP